MTQPEGAAEWRALLRLTGPHPALGPKPVDWDRLIALAARHKAVLALKRGVDAIGATGPEAMPAGPAGSLQALASNRLARAMKRAAETARVAGLFEDAGLPYAILKGAPLSLQIHGDAMWRDPGDIDLMVPKDQVAAAATLLKTEGFASEFGALLNSPRQQARVLACTNQLAFTEPKLKVQVELHWRWQKVDGMMPTDPDAVWGEDTARIGNRDIRVPNPADHFIYLCAHGAAHQWLRLKWLNDIRWIVQDPRFVQADWAGVVARARRLNMQTVVAAAILLVQRLDGVPVPPPLQALINTCPGAERLSRRDEAWMLEEAHLLADRNHSAPVAMAKMTLRHLRSSTLDQPKSLWTKFRILTRPTVFDLATVDLPWALGWAYGPIRIARMLRRKFRA